MSTAEVIKLEDYRNNEVAKVADLDNGYTRIANDLLEKIISFSFTLRQQNLLLAIARKTYGYNKKTDWIGNKQLSDLTGYAETRCSTIKNELIKMKVLITNGRECGINKNINEWDNNITQIGKTFTKSVNKTFTKTVNHSLPKEVNTKDNTTKESKDNTPISPKGENQAVQELEIQAILLLDHYNKSRNARCRDYSPFLKTLKTYSLDEIKTVIDWFEIIGKGDAKPQNICRMKYFDGYVSDAIKLQESKKQNKDVIDLFNEICGEKLGQIDDLTKSRVNKINNVINYLSQKTDRPLEALRAYFETLMEVSTELDFKNPTNNWEMTFDYVMSQDCIVKTREKYQRQGGY